MAEASKKGSKPGALVRKWLPFAGIVIIFLTFVVRDVLRDHFKDLAASVESAESLFIITDTLRVSPDYARELEKLEYKKPGVAVHQMILIMKSQGDYIRASVDTTRRLLDRLPGQEERIKSLEEFQLKFLHELSELYSEETKALDKSVIESVEPDESKVVVHYPKLFEMGIEIQKRSQEALAIAETMRGDAEYHYQVATRWFWGIFVVGLIFAAIGLHYGVEGVKVE